jgi:hypothetical protein
MLLYACSHRAVNVSKLLIYVPFYYYISVLILLCTCPHAPICVLILLFPHTPIYVSSYSYTCVLILLYMCPHTPRAPRVGARDADGFE